MRKLLVLALGAPVLVLSGATMVTAGEAGTSQVSLEDRVRSLETRVMQLESMVAGAQSSAGPERIELTTYCSSHVGCTEQARFACQSLGYSRSVPGRIDQQPNRSFILRSATCSN